MVNKKRLMMLFIILIFFSSAVRVLAEEIVVLSARDKYLTRIPFNAFTHETGIKIRLVTGKIDELLEILKKA